MIKNSTNLDIYRILRLLGLRSKHNGTTLLNKTLIVLLNTNDDYFNLEDIFTSISLSSNGKLNNKTIRESIRYAIDNRDESKSKDNFEKIFGYEYDEYIFTNKDLIKEILRILA